MMERIIREIPDGDKGVHVTVEDYMRRLARRDAGDPMVQRIARKFKGSDDEARIRAAFDYVVANVAYVSDPPDRELIAAPKYILSSRPFGDCDDMACALASLYLVMGYRCWFKVIAWRKKAYTHVYMLVEIPDQAIVIPVDPVMSSQGFGHELGDQKPILRSTLYPV